MALAGKIEGDLRVSGDVTIGGSLKPDLVRSSIAQETKVYPVRLTDLRVWDAAQTNLPGTAATDDLALIGGTFGTGVPSVKTSDSKATSVTQRARVLIPLPAEYDATGTVLIRCHAGMQTTVSDGTATIDVEAYLSDREGLVDGSDLVTTSATTINSLTLADKDFTVTATSLAPGDWLDVRITIAITDSATVGAVIGWLGSLELVCQVRG